MYIYVAYSRPNGRTDRAEILCGHGWPGGCNRLNKFEIIFNIFFHGQRQALQLVYIIKQDIRIYMLPIDGQTAGPIGLNFFVNMMGGRGVL